LLNVLQKLRNGDALTVNTLFDSEAVLHESCVKLEVFWCKNINNNLEFDIDQGYALLSFIKSLAMSQSSSILSGICKYYYALTSRNIVQQLPFPTTNKHYAHVIRLYHQHLHDGTKLDAVTGWLLYASFYYALRQYNTTLQIIDHVLSRCTPDMILMGKSNYTTDDIIHYKQNVLGCSNSTLSEKMRLATVNNVWYVKQSTLIPRELKTEVLVGHFRVPPVVMSHCLRVLCYHHLHKIYNRQQSLHDLLLTIRKMHFICGTTCSDSLTILGVCYETVGDKERAYLSYDGALQSPADICHTAAKRKVNLILT
jgi:hypothetical protein